MEETALSFMGSPNQPFEMTSKPELAIALLKGKSFVTEATSYTFDVVLPIPIPLTTFSLATTATEIGLLVYPVGSSIQYNLSVSV